jgi:homoprotocatechuate degradation regulator HpaR
MLEFSRSLPMMLYRTLDAVMPRFREIFKAFGLTEQQWRVLRVLWQCEQIPFRELAELTLIPAPSLVGVIDRLSRSGLAARRRCETDRRNVFVCATKKGRALQARVMPEVNKAYADLQRSVDAQTWSTVIAGLERISATDGLTFSKPTAKRKKTKDLT